MLRVGFSRFGKNSTVQTESGALREYLVKMETSDSTVALKATLKTAPLTASVGTRRRTWSIKFSG